MQRVFERRNDSQPIMTASDWPYAVNTVFNAGSTIAENGDTILLVRVEELSGRSHLTVARSKDGLTGWKVDKTPSMLPHPEHPLEEWGVEDPRITRLDELDCYGVCYTAYSNEGALVGLATTKDFSTWERKGAVLCPENKDAALFPRRINGRWLMIHRPVAGSVANMWLSASPDLEFWGDHRPLLRARSGPYWDAGKIGLSSQPLETEAGWLVMYHGVKNTCFGSIYRQGLALLDLDDPTRVLGRTKEWVFAPEESWERSGDVGNVVFSCGWTCVDDEVRMYYAGADTCMAVATAPLPRLLELVKAG